MKVPNYERPLPTSQIEEVRNGNWDRRFLMIPQVMWYFFFVAVIASALTEFVEGVRYYHFLLWLPLWWIGFFLEKKLGRKE